MDAKILIVDDSPVSAEFLKNILKQENHTVFISYDGKDIIGMIESHDIDIVLLDVIMPETNGYELLKELKNNETTRDIPVVMITSLTSPLEVKRALEAGAMDFIRKSSEPIEVYARINSALRLKQKQDLLKQNSLKDHLTQLYNKRFFNETIEKLIKEKSNYHKGISLIIIDFDFFKSINDHYGHTSGDTVLSAVASEMTKTVKSTDIVCRFGGEEFCVLSPDTTPFQAYMISERIRKNVEKMIFVFQDKAVSITISCGVSHTEGGDDKSGLKLVNEADSALYSAKANGRNQTVLFGDIRKKKGT